MTSGGLRVIAGALGIAATLITARSPAETPRPMSLISLAEVPRIQDVQLSPDGRFVSYSLGRADWQANRQVAHLWRQSTAGGAPTPLTTGDGESLARWSPDGRTLLFLARGEGGLQISLVSADGGQPRALTHHATGVFGGVPPVWSPDGSAVFFLASDPPSVARQDRDRVRDDVFAFEENYRQRHLWRITVADRGEQRVTDGNFSVLSFTLSADGQTLVEHRAPTPLASDSVRGEVWISDVKGDHAQALTRNGVEEFEAALSPDRSQVLFIAEMNDGAEPYYSAAVFLVPAAGGAPRRLVARFPYAVDHATWTSDGRGVLAVVNMGAHSEVYRFDLATGTAHALTDGRHSVQFFSVVPSAGRMVFQLDEPTRLGDAWTLPLDGGNPTRVTGIYDTLEQDFALPRQELVSWKGADGVTVEGLLFYPVDYAQGRRYPLVVQLHSGPQESDKYGYGPGVIVNYVPVLAAKGYAVLRPNYRGSTGYGDAFYRDVVGGYFHNMQSDVLAGVDAMVARGIADPDRLAIMGWSAGGHLTNKLITMTTRFKAAASASGVANWTSLLAETDIRANRSVWFGGLPWGPNASSDVFWNNSPIKDAARIRTPTLLIAGEEDVRVPMPQAIEMYRALKANDVPTRLLVAPREGHQWTELRHQVFKANAELEWFDHYVLGRTHVWERAPGDTVASEQPSVWP